MKIKHCKICGKELNDKSPIFYMMEECSDCVVYLNILETATGLLKFHVEKM